MHKGLDFLLIFGYGLRSSRSKGGPDLTALADFSKPLIGYDGKTVAEDIHL